MTDTSYLRDELTAILQAPAPDPKLARFLEEGPLANVYLWDLDNPQNVWSNRGFWRALGYELGDEHEPIAELAAMRGDDVQSATAEQYAQLVHEPEEEFDRIVRYQHANGSVRWFRSRALTLRNADGKPIRMLGYRTDVTPLMRREDERFQMIIDAAPYAMLALTTSGQVQLANRAAVRLLGHRAEELVGRSLQSVAPELFPALDLVVDDDADADGQPRSVKPRKKLLRRAKHKDGVPLDLEVSVSHVDTAQGRLTLLALSDVTERLRARKERELLASIVAASPDAIISSDLATTITSWNHGAEKLFGYAAHEAIGRSQQLIVPPDMLHEVREETLRMKELRSTTTWETKRLTKSGIEIDVSIAAAPLLDAAGDVVGVSKIIRDVREQKARDAELRRSNAALEHFAAMASHDLHEPLRAVVNYTELLSKRYQGQLDEKGNKYVHHIREGARRMQSLVADLLTYARVSSKGKPFDSVALNPLLSEVIQSLDLLVQDTDATFDIGDLPRVHGDEAQLRQLLQNVVTNALRHRGVEPPHLIIRCKPCPGGFLFWFADNGEGFPSDQAEQLFEMFRRHSNAADRDGTGLGLAICKRIVERHGGAIWAESRGETGSVFYFTLARNPDAAPAPRPV